MKLQAFVAKSKATLLWLTMTGVSIAVYFGFRCPAPGCPCCKMVGK